MCGTAVAEKKNQNVGDVTKVENYLACSPKTKAELVVLIRAGDEIFGQIDIDARTKDAFTRGDQEAVEMIADKLAEAWRSAGRLLPASHIGRHHVSHPARAAGWLCCIAQQRYLPHVAGRDRPGT